MSVILDASFAIPWVLTEVQSTKALAQLNRWQAAGIDRHVPALFAAEIASALRRHIRTGTLTEPDALRSMAGIFSAVVFAPDDPVLAARALGIAGIVGAGRAYDSLYAAPAERDGSELWTGDERFYNAAHPHFPFVHWVGHVTL
ncbi:MAG: type II toxin-antitoxin system VapC family toxin [Chloroflexi bacterium]|nr:type II toxin-antitoxin system VapC family toxin [Chloroflexota bacterium]